MATPGSYHRVRKALLLVLLLMLLPGLALAKGHDGQGALPLGAERDANGGLPCYDGNVEMNGCINIPFATDCDGSTTSC